MSKIFAYIKSNGEKEIYSSCENEYYCVAANGDIENTAYLKKLYTEGKPVESEEKLLLCCLSAMNEKNNTELLFKLTDTVFGNASFVFSPADESAVYCKGGISKLFIGICQNSFFLSSELEALLPRCEKYAVVENGQSAKLTKDRVIFFDIRHKRIKKSFAPISKERLETNNYHHPDEAFYCPLSARETFFRFVKSGVLSFDYMKLKRGYLNKLNKIILVGSGSAKNTALVCRELFETYCFITAAALDSEEFICSKTPIDKNTLLIAISENGNEKSTLEAVLKARNSGTKAIALTNNKYSALAIDCDYLISPKRDIKGIPPLPCFISDYFALGLFALWLGSKTNVISELLLGVSIKMAEMLPGIIQTATKTSIIYEGTAEQLLNSKEIFICSSGTVFPLSLKGAQLVRETTLKNAVSLSVSELCNMDEKLLSFSTVFALINDKERICSTAKKLAEINKKGANIVIITSESIAQELEGFENIITFNDSLPIFNPLPCISSLYKIALIAKEKADETEVDEIA